MRGREIAYNVPDCRAREGVPIAVQHDLDVTLGVSMELKQMLLECFHIVVNTDERCDGDWTIAIFEPDEKRLVSTSIADRDGRHVRGLEELERDETRDQILRDYIVLRKFAPRCENVGVPNAVVRVLVTVLGCGSKLSSDD